MICLDKYRNFLIFWLTLIPLCAAAQPSEEAAPPPADTSGVLLPDTLIADSLIIAPADTTPTASVDTTISYSAQDIEFLVGQRVMRLRGQAMISYKTMNLRAERITVNWDSNLVVAEGVVDTLWADTLQEQIDTVFIRGTPIFVDGDQTIHGEKMTYNLKTRKGRVTEGSTAYADGYYQGETMKKVSTDVLYAGQAAYTTCDLPEPHYTFRSKKMKLIVGDRVIAEPVILYFNEVPVAALPFGIFPSRHGRQSGLIIPTYGESSVQGRFLRHLGYYWAPHDYTDFQGLVDYYEKSGFLFSGLARYNWRYHLAGSLAGGFIRQHFESIQQRWELHVNHDQTIDPDTRLTVHGDFISDRSYYQQYSFNLNQQLQQTLRSDATLNHTFPGGKNSYSANLHHEQNLTNDEVTQEIPRFSFRRGQSTLIPAPKPALGDTTKPKTHWYHTIYYNYSGELLHRRSVTHPLSEPAGPLFSKRRAGARHTLSFSSPQTVSYFSVSPSLTVNEQWADEYLDYTNNFAGTTVSGFRARHTFSTGLSFNTKVYGYWTNPLSGVEAIRHVATPQIGLSFQPDFSDPEWGYYQDAIGPNGVKVRKDRFAGSLYGGTPRGKTFALNLQLSNLFQMKYGGEEKTADTAKAAAEKKKIDLFTLDFSTSYNFAADSLRFSSLNSGFRASPLSGSGGVGPLRSLSFDFSSSHSFYKWGATNQIDEYYFKLREGKILRLTSFDISTNAGLSIGTLVFSPSETRLETDTIGVAGSASSLYPDTAGLYEPSTEKSLPSDWFLGQVPFDFQLAFHYTINRFNPNTPSKTLWMNADVDASLTPNWQISYNTRVDLVNHKVVSSGITIYRDLHCWEARLTWNPLGIGQGYFLRINIKSPQLQDVKVERRRNQGSFMGF